MSYSYISCIAMLQGTVIEFKRTVDGRLITESKQFFASIKLTYETMSILFAYLSVTCIIDK